MKRIDERYKKRKMKKERKEGRKKDGAGVFQDVTNFTCLIFWRL